MQSARELQQFDQSSVNQEIRDSLRYQGIPASGSQHDVELAHLDQALSAFVLIMDGRRKLERLSHRRTVNYRGSHRGEAPRVKSLKTDPHD
jgi:hypothetical protein